MTTPVLADSNVYIDLLREGNDPAAALVADFGAFGLVTCGMVKFEVLRAVRPTNNYDRITAFFDVQQWVESDFIMWEEATKLARDLARIGIILPGPDILIAACAFRFGATVITADKHFSKIPNLSVIPSPYQPDSNFSESCLT